MKGLAALVVLIVAALAVAVARSGHEFPVYPSFYPHEIRIDAMTPERAGDLLLEGKIQAYVGAEPRFTKALPDSIHAIESLGSFVVVRVNPTSPLAKDTASACRVARAVVRDIGGRRGLLIFHPYPITPFQGDYLYHVDQADAAKARFSESAGAVTAPAPRDLRVHATSELARSLIHTHWYTQGPTWDAMVEDVSAADLIASATQTTNGWLGPPWARAGWFLAALLLADSVDDPSTRERVQVDLHRLETGAYDGAVERINLERDLVAGLAAGCRSVVAGYTVKREYVSTEYSAGIENIGFDALEGINSPIFIRTVKLKDFPWNGWLSLGIDAPPAAAWNPIAGFTDRFGRLMWSALGDPALLPAPNDAGWMLNRISDVRPTPKR
ncbi:MAG: hypothetical protein ACRDGM_06595 [bacterium]